MFVGRFASVVVCNKIDGSILLIHIEIISIHCLDPSGNEIPDKLLEIIALGVDFGIGMQDRVGNGNHIDASCAPSGRTGLTIDNVYKFLPAGLQL